MDFSNISKFISKFENFPSIDGSCNNLRKPKYGMAFTPLQRVYNNAYEDGIMEPRSKAKSGKPLPSAR